MYAVIKTGGKQYKAEEGRWIEVERLPLEVGATVEFTEVLLISNGENTQVGNPTVSGSKVIGKVVKEDRRKKVIVYKMRPKNTIEEKMVTDNTLQEFK